MSFLYAPDDFRPFPMTSYFRTIVPQRNQSEGSQTIQLICMTVGTKLTPNAAFIVSISRVTAHRNTVFFLSKTISKVVNTNEKLKAQPLLYFFFSSFVSPCSFYFPFLCSFLGGFSGSFCLRLLVFFSVKRLQFSFGTFSRIQQDNYALAFSDTFTLIFVNLRKSSNTQVSLFAFHFLLVKSELERRGG